MVASHAVAISLAAAQATLCVTAAPGMQLPGYASAQHDFVA